MSKAMLSVHFSGSLVELKAWLAEMPDNLASALHTSFSAEPRVEEPSLELACRAAALEELRNGKKIAAIKAVRTVCERAEHRGFLHTLRGAKAFVEMVEAEIEAARSEAPQVVFR